EYFADYIVNNTGNPITLTCSGNVNVNVNIHHGTDVDFSSDVTWGGTEVLTFTVTDGNETATDDIEVIVTPAAANLIIELPDSITFTAGESITEYFADYIVNNTGNPITLTCSGNMNVSVNIHHGTDVDFSSDENWYGTEVLTFTVTDGDETATDDIDIIVLPAGIELSMDLPAEITFERWTTIDVDFNQYIINNTGNELSLSCSGNENVLITIQNGLIVHLEGEPFWEGSELVDFVVSDGQGRIEAEDSVTITITPEPGDISIDLPEVITMITNTVREENLGAFVTSLYIFEFSWEQPENLLVEMNDMNHAFFSVLVPDWSGSEDITFTVTDYYGNTASDTVTLEVLPVSNLEFNLPSTFSFNENATVSRDLTGFVNESDITFSVEDEDNVTVTFTGMEMSITPTANWTGTDSIILTAENGNGDTVSDEIDIIVTENIDNSMAYKGGSYDGFDFACGFVSEFYLLSGVVVNAETYERIAGAVITTGSKETLSNENGEYELYLESGTYTITCSADDYISQTEEGVNLLENTVLNFQLAPDVSGDDVFEALTLLKGNYPNPFNPVTTIEFSLAENSQIILEIYNNKGQQVRTLLHEYCNAGTHSVIWDGHDSDNREVASGIYYYKIHTADFMQTRKMLLLK
ncbi:MAG: T9SS type A sorting domain-containing protein, partial [Candidatus Cloacimonetes bacterium]|nr:T9SS type A sorting domain-containing protein [Candidatus Cloacimonadota bacterium]